MRIYITLLIVLILTGLLMVVSFDPSYDFRPDNGNGRCGTVMKNTNQNFWSDDHPIGRYCKTQDGK